MIESDSSESTITYGCVDQHPIVPPSRNDLNLPPNPFKEVANMTVIQPDEDYSPQSPEPSDSSPISTPPMNLSILEGWQTPHTSTDNATFYPEDELRRVSWDISPSYTFDSNAPRPVSFTSRPFFTPPLPRRQKKWLWGCVFLKRGSVAADLRGLRLDRATTKDTDTLMLITNPITETFKKTVDYYCHAYL